MSVFGRFLSLVDSGVSYGNGATTLIAVLPLLPELAYQAFAGGSFIREWWFFLPAIVWVGFVFWRYLTFEVEDYRSSIRRAAQEEQEGSNG